MSRSHHRDDSLSDTVFSEEESGYHEVFSSKLSQVFSPNVSVTSSHAFYSPQVSAQDAYSPTVSNYSTYSQEVKYIFDPNFGNYYYNQSAQSMEKIQMPAHNYDPAGDSINEDYSQIQFATKKSNLQRKQSNSSQYSYKSQGHSSSQGHPIGGQGHLKNGQYVVPPPPPPRTCSSASTSQLSQHGDSTFTPRHRPPLFHSMSTSYSSGYCYPHNQGRRRTWSPDGLKLGYSTTSVRQDHRLRSYSNDQLVEQNFHVAENRDHIYEESESGPPRLAPISGILNKVGHFHYSPLHTLIKFFPNEPGLDQ